MIYITVKMSKDVPNMKMSKYEEVSEDMGGGYKPEIS